MSDNVTRKETSREKGGRRAKVRRFLAAKDFEGMMAASPRQRTLGSSLLGALFDQDELIRWRAIDGLGRLALQMKDNQLEGVREFIRRMFWQMNDESGGAIWMAPETIGHLLLIIPRLISEYGSPLLSNLRLSPFERGVHWSAHRIVQLQPLQLQPWLSHFQESLFLDDPVIRAYAAAALVAYGAVFEDEHLDKLKADTTEVREYDFEISDFRTVTAGEIVNRATRN